MFKKWSKERSAKDLEGLPRELQRVGKKTELPEHLKTEIKREAVAQEERSDVQGERKVLR